MRPRDWRSFWSGALVGAAVVKLLPIVVQAARPVARGLMVGAMDLSYRTRQMAAEAKEEFENMVAEARFQQAHQAEPSPLPSTSETQPPELPM